jgi:Zn-dependent protease
MPFSTLFFFFIIIIPSAIIHEYAHGAIADQLGDPTARNAGRLTLNPLAHIDLFGTILLPLFLIMAQIPILFAYAKPVPYNPYNLKNRKWGPALVGLAGPASNLLTAIIFGMVIRFFPASVDPGSALFSFVVFLSIIVYANILLAVFNLVPIPPLDGSKVLFALLPARLEHYYHQIERYGFIILLFFIFFAFQIIVPIISFLFKLIVGASFFGLISGM